MNTQTLESYRDRPHWSYSSLNQILNICSLQWCFEKLEKLPRPFTPIALAFGGVYHRVMEFIALTRLEQKLPTENDTRDLFHELWKREGEDGPPIEKDDELTPDDISKQGAELAVAYLKQIDPEERIVTMNEAFAVPVGDSERPLVGEIDCVVERADDLAVVDWKTSGKRWPKTQAEPREAARPPPSTCASRWCLGRGCAMDRRPSSCTRNWPCAATFPPWCCSPPPPRPM